MIKNFYNYFVAIIAKTFEQIAPTTRLKKFVFRFISVPGKWAYQGRMWRLKLHTNKPYDQLLI
jgi:hypothetical protein